MSNNWDDVLWEVSSQENTSNNYFLPYVKYASLFLGSFCLHKHTTGGIQLSGTAFDCTSTPLQVPYSRICNPELFHSETSHFVFSQQSKKHSVVVQKTETLIYPLLSGTNTNDSFQRQSLLAESEITSLTICGLNPNFSYCKKAKGLKIMVGTCTRDSVINRVSFKCKKPIFLWTGEEAWLFQSVSVRFGSSYKVQQHARK